jgi:hypothetical protein
MFTDLGLYLVGTLIIGVRLRASSLDCRTAGVLSMSRFRSPYSTSSLWCPGYIWGQNVIYSKGNAERLVSGKVKKVEAQIVWAQTWIV